MLDKILHVDGNNEIPRQLYSQFFTVFIKLCILSVTVEIRPYYLDLFYWNLINTRGSSTTFHLVR
jgi:hypothetical protein